MTPALLLWTLSTLAACASIEVETLWPELGGAFFGLAAGAGVWAVALLGAL